MNNRNTLYLVIISLLAMGHYQMTQGYELTLACNASYTLELGMAPLTVQTIYELPDIQCFGSAMTQNASLSLNQITIQKQNRQSNILEAIIPWVELSTDNRTVFVFPYLPEHIGAYQIQTEYSDEFGNFLNLY